MCRGAIGVDGPMAPSRMRCYLTGANVALQVRAPSSASA